MKQRVVVAMLAVCALLAVGNQTSAQTNGVYIKTAVSAWVNVPGCPNTGTATVTFTIAERVADDIYGASGQMHTFFDLKIGLPPGMVFENNSTTMWNTPNSADINNKLTQSYTGGVVYEWNDVRRAVGDCYDFRGVMGTRNLPPDQYSDLPPFPGAVNTLVLAGLEVKNTIKKDEISIIGVRIMLLPGFGTLPPPAYDLWAWSDRETGALTPPGRFVVRGMPTFSLDINQPLINFLPSPAYKLEFVEQPKVGPHDVQAQIPGENTATPQLWVVDCNGAKQVTTDWTGDVLADVTPSDGSYYNNVGPTYSGAHPTPNLSGQQSLTANLLTVQLVRIPVGNGLYTYGQNVDFSMSGPVSQATLTATNLRTLSAPITGILNAESESFTVALRPVTWTSPPVLGTPNYNSVSTKYWIAVDGAPEVQAVNQASNDVTSAPFGMEVWRGEFTSILTPSAPEIVSDDHLFTKFAGGPSFGNTTNAFELTANELSQVPKPEFTAFGFVYTTLWYDGSTTSSGSKHFDPRYEIAKTGIDNGALPVELTTFTASLRNQLVSLKWSTATETNNYGFDVERSEDGATWTKIGFVAGNGTTSSQHDYGFSNRLTETDMMRPTLSYRLRQIDRDGTFEYSPVVTVALAPAASSVKLMQNFPNPFNPSTNISFNLPEAGAVTLTVYNELGVEVARIHDAAQFEAGWHTAAFNASALPSGLYSYRLSTPAGSVAKTMIVTK